MKKLILLLCMLATAFAFAGDKPVFQAFAGSKDMLKIGNAKGGMHPFMLQVKGQEWAFQAQGMVAAPNGDSNLLLDSYLDGNVYVVVAYIPTLAGGSDGKDYQVGMFDAKLYLEDDALDTRAVKFKLLPPANDDWAAGMAAEAVSTGAPLKSSLWDGSRDVEITRTAATPLTKDDLNPKPKAKRVVKAAEPEPAPAPAVKRRVVKKAPVEEEEEEPVVRKRVIKKKRVADEDEAPATRKVVKKRKVVVEEDDDEDEGLSIKEKRRRAAARKNAAY